MKKLLIPTLLATLIAPVTSQAQLVSPGGVFTEGNTIVDRWDPTDKNTAGSAPDGLSWGAHPGKPITIPRPSGAIWNAPFYSPTGDNSSYLIGTSVGTLGGPYVGNSSIYFGGSAFDVNLFTGSVSITETSALPGVRTIGLQIYTSEYAGYDFYNNELPQLFINGESSGISATFTEILSRHYLGEVSYGGTMHDKYENTYYLQWDITDTVTDFEIIFSGVMHAQIFGIQLEQTDAAYTSAAIPEPSTYALLAMSGIGGLLALRRRRVS